MGTIQRRQWRKQGIPPDDNPQISYEAIDSLCLPEVCIYKVLGRKLCSSNTEFCISTSTPSSGRLNMAHHAHTISLPSTSHPLTLAVEEQLCRLRASLEATISSSASISHSLSGLKILYECVEDFLQMQHIQEDLSDDVLAGSLELLDICSTARDALSQMKQSAQDLQSSCRRRRGGDLDMTNEIGAYMSSKKKINKLIRKSLGDLKRMNKKDQDLVAMVSVLRDVEATTVAVFESLLSFLSSPNQSSWSLISKLMSTKPRACVGEVPNSSELEKVDVALSSLISHKQYKVEDVKNVQKPLEALEMSIQDLEEGLECVFRRLIKTRVSLLNIFNQ